jgi:UPF0042 nucleotide-binding protein
MMNMEQASLALRDLVVITGFSGAGKSTVMAAFEDEGYFCVDNLPPEMISSLVELFTHAGSKVERAAVVSDPRAGTYFAGMAEMVDRLRERSLPVRVLFLEASDETLQTRSKETRRRHPLAPRGSVAEGIGRERSLLAPMRERADVIIDSGGLTAAQLRRKLAEQLFPSSTPGGLSITFESFGFKYGPVRDTDLMFDVRFLPNPHYDPALRPLTGLDPRVVAAVNDGGALDEFYAKLDPLLDYLLPQYLTEGKSHLLVGIGCTGGRHRSVAIVEGLARRYRDWGSGAYQVEVLHRDIEKPT